MKTIREIVDDDQEIPKYINGDYDKAVHYMAMYKGTCSILRDALTDYELWMAV